MSREELREIVEGLKRNVEDRRRADLPVWKERAAPPAKTPPPPAASAQLNLKDSSSVAGAQVPIPPTVEPNVDNLPGSLEEWRAQIGDCQRCPLSATRKKLVYGVGNPKAAVMFIGEGPGYMEDRQGEPFVGPAGQLLDKIIAAVGLTRKPSEPSWSWVYIANVVKCHPMIDPSDPEKRGNDRPPAPEEMEKCFPFLLGQIRLIRPKVIVTLGATAAKAVLKTPQSISTLRGRWTDFPAFEGEPPVPLMPTYHPAALLRNPALKRDVWEDMKSLKARLDGLLA